MAATPPAPSPVYDNTGNFELNYEHSYDYEYQQHHVHKRSPQIQGLRIFGGKKVAKKALFVFTFGKREAEPSYGYNSHGNGMGYLQGKNMDKLIQG